MLKLLPFSVKEMSLPSWERGLKFFNSEVQQQAYLSLPSWERGLKLKCILAVAIVTRRSPRGSVD